MEDKRTDVLYGSLGLIILKTLEALGPLHGYRIARRIDQISGDHLALNQGTIELDGRRSCFPQSLMAVDWLAWTLYIPINR